MFQKYIVPAIGVGAFIVGGMLAQKKAIEVVEDIKEYMDDTPSSS